MIEALLAFKGRFMPRYYFHVCNKVQIADPYGELLADKESALAHAVEVCRELMFKRSEMLGQAWAHWTLRVKDTQGKTIHTLPLAEIPTDNTRH